MLKPKKEKIDSLFRTIEENNSQFMNFLKSRYPVFHNSVFFSKDFQYGIKRYLESKNIELNSTDNEELSDSLAKSFEEKGIFIKTNKIGWRINYPQFMTKTPGDPF